MASADGTCVASAATDVGSAKRGFLLGMTDAPRTDTSGAIGAGVNLFPGRCGAGVLLCLPPAQSLRAAYHPSGGSQASAILIGVRKIALLVVAVGVVAVVVIGL